ncbi:hypothetical protein BC826DRAFT_512307 [Russula brevipes]|nr:hypothetical protein BC826DRAFT_512307 [Russula brevipes]
MVLSSPARALQSHASRIENSLPTSIPSLSGHTVSSTLLPSTNAQILLINHHRCPPHTQINSLSKTPNMPCVILQLRHCLLKLFPDTLTPSLSVFVLRSRVLVLGTADEQLDASKAYANDITLGAPTVKSTLEIACAQSSRTTSRMALHSRASLGALIWTLAGPSLLVVSKC